MNLPSWLQIDPSSRLNFRRGHLGWFLRWRTLILKPGLPVSLIVGLGFAPRGLNLGFWPSVGASLVLAFFGYYFGTSRVLRALSPEEYAEVRIAGQSVTDVFSTISFHIADLLRSLLKKNSKLGKFEKAILDICNDGEAGDPEKCDQLHAYLRTYDTPRKRRRLLRRLDVILTKNRFIVDRIEAMKRLAATQLGIPSDRLCDHLFQFSPGVFLKEVRAYANNCDTLLRESRDLRPDRVAEFRRIIESNFVLHVDAETCRKQQRRLLGNRELHAPIAELACLHSGSRSLEVYARAIAAVAERLSARLKSWNGSVDDRSGFFKYCEEQIQFLHNAQRIYPGFDLTAGLIRALDLRPAPVDGVKAVVLEESDGVRSRQEPKQGRALAILNRLSLSSRRHPRATHSGTTVQPPQFILLERDEGPAANKAMLPLNLAALIGMPLYVSRSLKSGRAASLKSFSALCLESKILEPHPGGRVFIATYGYSTSVEDLLVHGLKAYRDVSKSRYRPPCVFILQIAERDRIDAKTLEYEINLQAQPDQYRSLAVGDQEMLLGLTGPKDRVIFLLGAECVSKDLLIVRPRGTTQIIDEILDKLARRGCERYVIVTVDEYKYYAEDGSPVIDQFLLDGQHLNRITVSGDNGLVDAAIAGNNVVYSKRQLDLSNRGMVVDGVVFLPSDKRKKADRRVRPTPDLLDAIRNHAYELGVQRGSKVDSDADWLQAEREVVAQLRNRPVNDVVGIRRAIQDRRQVAH